MTDSTPPVVIRDNKTLRQHFDELGQDSIIVGLLNIKPVEESLFLDLVERGVKIFPPAISQVLSRSKCLQAVAFRKWMIPLTTVITVQRDLIHAVGRYGAANIGSVITKQDRKNCGLGINLWPSVEDVFNQVCFGKLDYPFVLQPFVPDAKDVRVIVIGDYQEAYWRSSSVSFRNNLHFGGRSAVYTLNGYEKSLCAAVMDRGRFPYAHIDLLMCPSGEIYLSEINLRGGLKGATINGREYRKRIKALEEDFLRGSV